MQPGTILSDCQKPREGIGRATAPLAYVRIRRLCAIIEPDKRFARIRSVRWACKPGLSEET